MYKLETQENGYIRVLSNGMIVSHGFTREEDALHSIWVINGRKHDDFYVADKDGNVKCIDRGEL